MFLTHSPSNEHLAEVFLARVEFSLQEGSRGQKLCALSSLLGLNWVRPGVRWVLCAHVAAKPTFVAELFVSPLYQRGWELPSPVAVVLAGTLESPMGQWDSSNRI